MSNLVEILPVGINLFNFKEQRDRKTERRTERERGREK
jgi:hypothetical protein